MDFAVPVDHRVKTKEREKIAKYLDLARELKNLWNMKETVMLIVVEALGMVPTGLEKGELVIRGRIETIKLVALIKLIKYFDVFLRP